MKNLFNNIALFFVFLLLFICCVLYRAEVSDGVVQGIDYCLYVLIPSLFPFMFLSSLFSLTKPCFYITKLCQNFTKYVLKLPPICFSAVLFGLCFGYPVGAKLVSGLFEDGEINEEEKNRLMLYTLNPGIPFTVLFVGAQVLGSINVGVLLFISTVVASLLIAILTALFKPLPRRGLNKTYIKKKNIIEKAAKISLSATVNMCVHVVIFSSFVPLLYIMGVNDFFSGANAQSLFFMGVDIIHGVEVAKSLGTGSLIYVMGLSFGGLCVHLQVFSFFKNVNFGKFYLARICNVLISGGVFSLLIYLFPQSIQVISSFNAIPIKVFSGSALGSLSLLLLSTVYIYLSKESSS